MILLDRRGLAAVATCLLAAAATAGCDMGNWDDTGHCDLARHYQSVEQHECGLGPDGPVLCSWQLSFEHWADDNEGGEYEWSHSDVQESGRYECVDRDVTAKDQAGRTMQVSLDASGRLTWEGVAYQPVPLTP